VTLCTPKLGTGSQHGGYRSTVPEIVIERVDALHESAIGSAPTLTVEYFHSYRYADR
jgi:hypothetical protein